MKERCILNDRCLGGVEKTKALLVNVGSERCLDDGFTSKESKMFEGGGVVDVDGEMAVCQIRADGISMLIRSIRDPDVPMVGHVVVVLGEQVWSKNFVDAACRWWTMRWCRRRHGALSRRGVRHCESR